MQDTTLHRGSCAAFTASARTAQAIDLALAEHQRYLVWLSRQPLQ